MTENREEAQKLQVMHCPKSQGERESMQRVRERNMKMEQETQILQRKESKRHLPCMLMQFFPQPN